MFTICDNKLTFTENKLKNNWLTRTTTKKWIGHLCTNLPTGMGGASADGTSGVSGLYLPWPSPHPAAGPSEDCRLLWEEEMGHGMEVRSFSSQANLHFQIAVLWQLCKDRRYVPQILVITEWVKSWKSGRAADIQLKWRRMILKVTSLLMALHHCGSLRVCLRRL